MGFVYSRFIWILAAAQPAMPGPLNWRDKHEYADATQTTGAIAALQLSLLRESSFPPERGT